MMKSSRYGVLVLCLAVSAAGQIVATLFNFNGAAGRGPRYMSLIQGTDGNFYGTTQTSGIFNAGAVFSITPHVPAGATSGRVKVTTPSGTLTSNLPFVIQ